MSSALVPSEKDLRSLAEIVSADRLDVPEHGLPVSLLADLMGQISCDLVLCQGFDSQRQSIWFSQQIPDDEPGEDSEESISLAHWEHYWESKPCSYPDRTGDLRSILKIADFYSSREWHSSGMYSDVYRPQGFEPEMQLCLPMSPREGAETGRTVRLYLFRGPGSDFSERDRDMLTLLRPHIYEAYAEVGRQHTPSPRLTPRQWDLMHLIASGHTNSQVACQLGLSEGTVRTHLEHIYTRLEVQNRTAAVMRAFPDRVGVA
ncbi:MAG TPA: LuxR C-terminal-related transcriptional regulator [Acidimicrobiales bacterium]